MKGLQWRIAIAVWLSVGAASAAAAQGVPGAGRGRALPRYDTSTVQEIEGTVIRVDTVPGLSGRDGGVHLITLVGRDTLPVHLGPVSYMAQQTIRFTAGEKIRVRGSRTTFNGKAAVIAAEVRNASGARLTLRDRQGVPQWGRQPAASGRMRRP